MSNLDKPVKQLPTSPERAEEILNKFRTCSRDHLLSFTNDQACMDIAKVWPSLDMLINQAWRDMARPVGDKDSVDNLNAIHTATSQLISRLHEFADQGRELLETTN